MALSKHRVLVRGKTPHPHEAEAIDFIIGALPDNEPYSLWALVDLVDPSGRLYELDAVILGYSALYLVEVKSHPGEVCGGVVDWEYHFPDGGVSFRENPLRLVNQKARVLAGLLDRKMGRQRPWVEPLVLLSAPNVKVALDAQGSLKVVTRQTFERAITHGEFHGASPELMRFRVDQPTAKETRKALREIGLVPSKGALKIGDFAIGDILEEGPGYQDREAHHEQLREMHRRVRLYVIPSSTTPERRDQLRRAAEREARVLTVLGDHRNILGCKDYLRDGPTGAPCLVFDQFEDALPLDAFLRQHPDLSFDDRITILRQIGEALEYCHRKDVVHRGLSPSAVLVRRQPSDNRIETRLYNFQLAIRPEGSIGTDHLSYGPRTVPISIALPS
jgi:hypothetical protein